MANRKFDKAVDGILQNDKRYAAAAYVFVRMALDYTVKRLCEKSPDRRNKQVSTTELLEGIREFALETFGPMAMSLFEEWGVASCEDIGQIVFNLIDAQALRKSDEDKLEDFSGGFDFREAFVVPFLPKKRKAKK